MAGHYTKGVIDSEELSDGRKKRILGYIDRERRSKYYIEFQRPGRQKQDGTWYWPKACWPILFDTKDQAHDAMTCLPIFLNNPSKSSCKPRFKSASVKRVVRKKK